MFNSHNQRGLVINIVNKSYNVNKTAILKYLHRLLKDILLIKFTKE